MLAAVAALTLALGGSVASITPAVAAPGDPVVFADSNLEDAVNAALGQNPGETITEAQAASITSLNAGTSSISDISGIEHLTGLTFLALNGNNITDVSLLSGLSNLTNLNLNANSISDVTPLSGLTSLEGLRLGSNSISDVSSLSSLAGLSKLNLQRNNISDVSSLSSLVNLKELTLDRNNISDVSPLAGLTYLVELYLQENRIADLGPLAGLTNLTHLSLHSNSFSNVSPLAGLTNISSLSLFGQSIAMPDAVAGESTANPVTDVAGSQVAVTSGASDFDYDPSSNTWSFTSTGAQVAGWYTTVDVGTLTEVLFSGNISQNITDPLSSEVRVSKTVDATFVRVHGWELDKSGEVGQVTVDGETATAEASYTVTATSTDATNDYYILEGTITVANESDEEITITSISDLPAVGTDAVCAVDDAADVTLQAGGSASFDYSCTLTDTPTDGTNTATVVWTAQGEEHTSETTEDVVFTERDTSFETITVLDDHGNPDSGFTELGTVIWNSDQPVFTFEYTETFTGLPVGECTSVTNTALIEQTEQAADTTIAICPEASTPSEFGDDEPNNGSDQPNNGDDGDKEASWLPNTGSKATPLMLVAGGGLLFAGCGILIWRRRLERSTQTAAH